MINEPAAETWDDELEDLFLRVGHRFGRVEPRRRMRDYVRGLLGPVGRKSGRQLAEYASHATPDGLQHLLAGACWDTDEIRDELQHYVAEHLGEDDGVLIIDDTGFVKKGTTSAGVQRQYSGTAGRTENPPKGVPPARSGSSPPTPPPEAALWSTVSSTSSSPGPRTGTAAARRRSPTNGTSIPRATLPRTLTPLSARTPLAVSVKRLDRMTGDRIR
ncbi:transposase [Streptomyces chlorus]|uniref:Transposase n=1 Tax=Streptomyces chlorus TaxID=887452 RepID=A0ABW1DWV5_9ACTN